MVVVDGMNAEQGDLLPQKLRVNKQEGKESVPHAVLSGGMI